MKKLIEKSGLNQREFAEAFGIPLRTIQNWATGQRECPEYVYNMMNELVDLNRGYYICQVGIVEELFIEKFFTLDAAKAYKDKLRDNEDIEIRKYVADIDDENCTCFDYDVF